MIVLEPWMDGFVLRIDGQEIIRHSTKMPALFVGKPRTSLVPSFMTKKAQDISIAWRGIGPLSIEREDFFHCRMHAASGMSIHVSHRQGLVSLGFEGTDSMLRIKLTTSKGSDVFGLGPSTSYNMKRTTTTIPATESTGNLEAAEIPRLPIAFYSDGYWLALEGGGKTYLHIGDGKTDIECRSRLERLVFGYGSTCKEAMARLTWYRYGITDTEKSRTGANAAAEGRLPIPFETVGRHHEDFFTDEGWSKALGAGVAYLIPEDKARSEDFFTIMQSLSFAGVGCICFPISQGSDSKNPLRFARQTLELAMVAPLFLSPGEENVQDPMERGLFSRARAVFEALAPYRRQCLEDWKSEGIPFFCHPWIRYEGQKELLDVSDCLMVGSDLVISESPGMFGRAKTLRLPDDDWVHLWTSRRFGGGRVSIDAPPGVPALFYREKSKHGALFDQIRRMATRL